MLLKRANQQGSRQVAGMIGSPWPRRRAERLGNRPSHHRDEEGAILVLALIYTIVAGLVVTALATWAANDLNNTKTFNQARSMNYAASSVTNVAIQSIRSNPLLTGTVPQGVALPISNCWVPDPSSSNGVVVSQLNVNQFWMATWCTTKENLASPATRVVTFYTCQSSLASGAQASAITNAQNACVAKPLIKAVVTFDDYPPGGSTPLATQCSQWCGEGTQINSWVWAGGKT